ncbi:carbohydrate binding domain-containing protein [Alkalitalea saponilacus]|uniref:Carbohydrate binding domain-containing protein n=1 Tax=Alkalitalea saponilacus TaxID=889453 RepID=A0A1T5A9C7_9BACT|nr:carbohydrate binding domain-containing protein [Alkalitalea saponilacus]ASB48782.1 hypothetical protein CDL62_06375 [Alkalitalea saponilacus]SKB31592.1 Carbohydrate binding domain-containing protein [Alkalitalea saponilacus]
MKKIYNLIVALFVCSVLVNAEEPVYTNILPSGNFEGFADKAATGWAFWNSTEWDLVASDNTLDATSTQMIKAVARDNATNAWDAQLVSPTLDITIDKEYTITFQVRSNVAGQGRISLGDNQLSNQYLPDFNTSNEWVELSFGPYTAIGEELSIRFDIGYIADVEYYFDNVRVYTILEDENGDENGETGPINVFPAGSFDGYADKAALLTEWNLTNGPVDELELLASNNTLDDNSVNMVKLVAGTGTDAWSLQFTTPVIPLEEGKHYAVSFDIRSEGVGKMRISTSAADQFIDNQYWEDIDTDENWTNFRFEYTYGDPSRPLIAGPANAVQLNFDMGTIPEMTYYLDNVKVIELSDATSTPELFKIEGSPVYATNGNVIIDDAFGKNIEIYAITGVRVYGASATADSVTVPLSNGIYIVVVNNVATKVLVK